MTKYDDFKFPTNPKLPHAGDARWCAIVGGAFVVCLIASGLILFLGGLL